MSMKANTIILSAVAAFALISASMAQSAQAEPAATPAGVTSTGPEHASTDVSARRRYARRGYRNNAAGAAFMGLALGTMGAVIANQQRRDYYRPRYYGQPHYGNGYGYGGGYVSSPYDAYGRVRVCGNGYYAYGCGDY